MRTKEFYGHTVTEEGEFINDRGHSIAVRRSGALNIILKHNGVRKSFMVGRVLYYLFVEAFDMNDKNILVGFKDGNIRNTELSNLYLMDRKGLPIENLNVNIECVKNDFREIIDFKSTETHVDITEDDLGFAEGKKKLKQHIYIERNSKVIKLAKEKFKAEHGKLYCEVCGFDFEKTYGEIGQDFIEGHHSIPVSDIPEDYKTRIDDIVLVCSNCHSMLHRKRPWLSKKQLKKLLKSN